MAEAPSTNRHDVALPDVVSAAQWRESSEAMLAKEKALAVALDELSAERRRMPMMRVDASYRFIGPQGEVGLLDLFEGRRQLMVYRFFYAEDVEGWPDAGCTGLLPLRRQRHPSRAPQRPRHHVRSSRRRRPRLALRPTESGSHRQAKVDRVAISSTSTGRACGVRALPLAAGVRGVAAAIASHCDSETFRPGFAYPADRKSFPFGSGIWLPSDYGTQPARRTLTSTTDKAASLGAATHQGRHHHETFPSWNPHRHRRHRRRDNHPHRTRSQREAGQL